MKKDKSKLLIPTLALGALAVAGLIGVNGVSADENEERTSLYQRIAAQFNLDEDEVKAFVDSDREERQAEMQANYEEKLDSLVSEGKITEDQKQAILDKKEEMKSEREENRESMKDLTEEEREAAREDREADREERRSEMESWLNDNGIDADLLEGIFGGGNKGGHRGGHSGK